MTNKVDFSNAIFLHKKCSNKFIFTVEHREIFQFELTSLITFDRALLQSGYTCTRGNFALSIRSWEKGCTYRRRPHFKLRAIGERSIIDREYVMPLAFRVMDSSYIKLVPRQSVRRISP
ncbi:hypothetical protein QUA20_18825 [Microcoleus sp. Pol7_A1]|uniref:hypothetical protein n=1 Tax=Microcoleus sp. Pol7_A1 TaxID=2818893 RepID=UPI002FD3B4ED